MTSLPIANLTRHKLRSVLSVLGIAVGIALFILLPSLADGMIREVADRMQNVDAHLLVYPRGINPVFDTVAPMDLADEARLAAVEGVASAMPVAIWRVDMAGQRQRIFGVRPADLLRLGQGVRFLAGRPLQAGLEMVIDDRLARAGGYRVGQVVEVLGGRQIRIVGIVDGMAGRVAMPLDTLQEIAFARGAVSFFFVKCRPDASPADVADRLFRRYDLAVLPLADYNQLLESNLQALRQFLWAVSAVALAISFVVVLLTMYTAVVARTREVGILKSLGAGPGFILRAILAESLLLCLAGAVAGSLLSSLGAWLIQAHLPLVTIRISWPWIAQGFLLAAAGGVLGAAYPALAACRMDAVQSLSYE